MNIQYQTYGIQGYGLGQAAIRNLFQYYNKISGLIWKENVLSIAILDICLGADIQYLIILI